MTRGTLLALVLSFASAPASHACEGADCTHAHVVDARRAARDPRHIGTHCSYSTAAMVGRVLDKGAPWSFEGTLAVVPEAGSEAFATPYRASDGSEILANEVLDEVARLPAVEGAPLRLVGRVLEARGRRFVVVESVLGR